MVEIKLTTGQTAITDDIYKHFTQFDWRLSYDNHVCAYVGEVDFPLRKLVAGLGINDKRDVNYKNGNPLDCRRENFIIVEKSKLKIIKKTLDTNL